MNTEERREWICWLIPHDGEGPGRIGARRVKKRQWSDSEEYLPIDASDAAEIYAAQLFERNEDDYPWDGDHAYIGVELTADVAMAYRCVKRIKIDVDVDVADWIKPEALRPAVT